MTLGRVFRLLLFGFAVALAASTVTLIGYGPVALMAVLIAGAAMLGLFLKRELS
jgi:hypothetical protein